MLVIGSDTHMLKGAASKIASYNWFRYGEINRKLPNSAIFDPKRNETKGQATNQSRDRIQHCYEVVHSFMPVSHSGEQMAYVIRQDAPDN